MSRVAMIMFLGSALSALGCGGPSPPAPGFERELTRPAGCADVLMYNRNTDDTLALVFKSSGQVAATRSAGMVQSFALTLPMSGISLRLYQGIRLTGDYCNDVYIPGTEPKVAVERTAVSGSATLVVTPGTGSDNFKGTLQLSNIQFTDEITGAPAVLLNGLELRDVAIGWFAG